MPAATVLLPTHDHGPMLLHSLRSVQEQTVGDLEILVVGDGVPDVTRDIVRGLAAEDPRIRFFDNPKGASRGELHRRAALETARSEIVCYQADDDLWLPGHVEELRRLLADADFAHTVALQADPDGAVFPWLAALGSGAFRALVHTGANFMPLSVTGHTLAAYRRLPHGWRTTPDGTPTDLYMWLQFLDQPGIRPVSGSRPTALHLAAPQRRNWTPEQRLVELEEWAGRLASSEWRNELEPLLAGRCASGSRRLRRRVRLLEPLAGIARHRQLLGKPPRRIASEIWGREVRRATVRLAPARWPGADTKPRSWE